MNLELYWAQVRRYHRSILDKTIPYRNHRWVAAFFLILIYFIRIILINGHYITTYFLMLYLLDRFLGFLSPRDIPDFGQENDQEGVMQLDGIHDPSIKNANASFLPTSSTDEFKPFFRRVKQMDFWLSVVRGFSVSFVLTFFQFLNLPVYWPLLVFYFFMLMAVLLKQRIQHMIKHKYIPMDIGKKIFKQQRGGGIKMTQNENSILNSSGKGAGTGRQNKNGYSSQLV